MGVAAAKRMKMKYVPAAAIDDKGTNVADLMGPYRIFTESIRALLKSHVLLCRNGPERTPPQAFVSPQTVRIGGL